MVLRSGKEHRRGHKHFMLELWSQFSHVFLAGLGRRVKKAGLGQQGFPVAVLIALGKQASLLNGCFSTVTAFQWC